jgi:hypothetical protein
LLSNSTRKAAAPLGLTAGVTVGVVPKSKKPTGTAWRT